MEMSDFFIFDGFDQQISTLDLERNFQQSIIIKQDPNKSGILSFLKKIEKESDSPRPERVIPPLMRPRREY